MFSIPLVTADIETYLDCFLLTAKIYGRPEIYTFEISNRKNQKQELLNFLTWITQNNYHMVGYNIVGFDYPIIHDFMTNPAPFDARRAFDLAQQIIDGQKYGFSQLTVPHHKRYFPIIDLVKIWHFDSDSRRTRLKDLQFAMRSETIEDLPFDFRKPLAFNQIDELILYNKHDVTETEKFLEFTKDRLQLRLDLQALGTIKGDIVNWSDSKLGEQFFINKLGRERCYDGGKPKGTHHKIVEFKNCILPSIEFRREEFQEVLETFKTKVWVRDDTDHNKTISFNRSIGGIPFHFGSGGVHASVEARTFRASNNFRIIDIDVSSMYPSIGIVNNFYPSHLGQFFVEVYKQLKADRKSYKKGSAMNAVLKIALNAVYGKSNSEFSPMFDIAYLFKITLNGQLRLLQLVEGLLAIPDLELIQCNTDGITAKVPVQYIQMFEMIKKFWEQDSGLELEQVEYKSMFIKDVNNYIAVGIDGKIKRKGCYWYAESWEDYDEATGHWHTDNSQMVVAKIAEKVMTDGWNPEALLRIHRDPFDFMIRQKVKGGQKCFIGDTETQKTCRYYVTTNGEPMKTIKPPAGPYGEFKRKPKITDALYNSVIAEIGKGVWDSRIHTKNESKYEDVVSFVKAGYLVTDTSDAKNFEWSNIDYKYYLEEIEKIVIKETS